MAEDKIEPSPKEKKLILKLAYVIYYLLEALADLGVFTLYVIWAAVPQLVPEVQDSVSIKYDPVAYWPLYTFVLARAVVGFLHVAWFSMLCKRIYQLDAIRILFLCLHAATWAAFIVLFYAVVSAPTPLFGISAVFFVFDCLLGIIECMASHYFGRDRIIRSLFKKGLAVATTPPTMQNMTTDK